MTTIATIIGDALREINVINEVQSPSTEQNTQSLRKLNQVMEQWKEDGIDFGWFAQDSVNNTIPVPDWAELVVTLGLAIRCCPQYGASLSIESAAIFTDAYNTLLRKFQSESMDNADMSHMPIGGGHFDSRYDILSDT